MLKNTAVRALGLPILRLELSRGDARLLGMAQLEFGLFETLPSVVNPEPARAYDELLASIQLAERVGYKYLFVIEHQSSPYPGISAPNVFLASVARATASIRLGAMVYQLPFHHPVRLAQEIATLDQLREVALISASAMASQSRSSKVGASTSRSVAPLV